MKKQLIRLGTASTMAGLILGTAAVAGASTASIDTTGPDSHNSVEWKNKLSFDLRNDNDIHVTNNNPQSASSGKVEVEHNTTGGDATSGGAANDSSLDASVAINNSGSNWADMFSGGMASDDASIYKTGPDSHNMIEFNNEAKIEVDNDSDVTITNNVNQKATSGSAEVSGNTSGGDATSGDASNTSSSTFTLDITN